ncbi:hypothetical protein [Actinacidiphila acidipaludis]|uniref:Uncharacterized protein n=1 Tax=Actinacidiphila acidipaludis TaxID=2873382 RepID=A0ABS7Q288_9ACTN|nr:hypothetical protein [Streptomyces acidipaludis]MBY8877257.1 hypothetical protein [Streptomyces acidipaludis]
MNDVWSNVTPIEHALMICAQEAWGILAYAEGDIEDGEDYEQDDLIRGVLNLVDRGWVHVHRIEPWTAPDGHTGVDYGPPVPRPGIPSLLAEPATWDDPEDPSWVGAVTLSFTDAWRELRRQC